eukprot:g16478.t1
MGIDCRKVWKHFSKDLGLPEPKLNAFLLLIHLDYAIRQGKTVLSKIFTAENKGPRNQLEEALWEALYELDPSFDGRVYLPILDRALKVLASSGIYSRKQQRREEDREYGPMAYGETSPVRAISIPMEADSINNFRTGSEVAAGFLGVCAIFPRAFKCFREQQHDLLSFHSSFKNLGDEEAKADSEQTT